MIVARDLPYLIGFLVIVAATFWLVARLADSGALERWARPVFGAIVFVAFTVLAARDVVTVEKVNWPTVALYAVAAIFAAIDAWRAWRRRRAVTSAAPPGPRASS